MSEQPHRLASVAALLAGAALMILATGLAGTSAALRMTLEGFSSLAVGAAVGAYFGGLTLGALRAPLLLRGVGHIRTFAALCATACAATVALPMVLSPLAWIALRALTGFAMAGLYMTVESWINDRATPATRGSLLAVYMITNQAALAGGQALVPVYPQGDNDIFSLAALLFAAALIPVALTKSEQPPLPTVPRFGARAILRSAPLAAITAVASGVFVGVLLGLGPVYASALGHETGAVAAFMIAVVLGGMLLQWPVGRVSDRVGRRPIIFVSSALLAVASVVSGWAVPSSLGSLLVTGGTLGALGFTLYPLGLAYAVDLIGPEESLAVSGTLLLGYGAGAALGPIVGASVLARLGPSGLSYLVAVLPTAVALFAIVRAILRPRVPVSEPYQAMPLPQTAPSADLDPRTET